MMILGAIRALLKSGNVKKTYYDEAYHRQERDMTMTERVGLCIMGAITFPVICPYGVYKDINRLEVCMRGLDQQKYKTSVLSPSDVLF